MAECDGSSHRSRHVGALFGRVPTFTIGGVSGSRGFVHFARFGTVPALHLDVTDALTTPADALNTWALTDAMPARTDAEITAALAAALVDTIEGETLDTLSPSEFESARSCDITVTDSCGTTEHAATSAYAARYELDVFFRPTPSVMRACTSDFASLRDAGVDMAETAMALGWVE